MIIARTKCVLPGFTMIELVLSITVMMVLAGLALPVYQSFQNKNDLDLSAMYLAQLMRRAEVLAGAADGDSAWGVKIQSGSIVLFEGTSYALRDTTRDETISISNSVTGSGLTEVVFSKVTGLPQTTGTTTFTSASGEVITVAINSKGAVSY